MVFDLFSAEKCPVERVRRLRNGLAEIVVSPYEADSAPNECVMCYSMTRLVADKTVASSEARDYICWHGGFNVFDVRLRHIDHPPSMSDLQKLNQFKIHNKVLKNTVLLHWSLRVQIWGSTVYVHIYVFTGREWDNLAATRSVTHWFTSVKVTNVRSPPFVR